MDVDFLIRTLLFFLNSFAIGLFCIVSSRWLTKLEREHEEIAEAINDFKGTAMVATKNAINVHLEYLVVRMDKLKEQERYEEMQEVAELILKLKAEDKRLADAIKEIYKGQ